MSNIDLSIGGTSLVLVLAGVIVLILGMIFLMRSNYAKRSQQGISPSGEAKSPLEGRNKYPGADVFKLSGTFFNLGLALALGLTVLAFSWTQYEDDVYIPDDALELDEEIEIEPPRTAEPPPPPPPPPPPVIEEVPEEEILEEEEVEFVDQSVMEETAIEEPPIVVDAPPPPPPPPPPPEP